MNRRGVVGDLTIVLASFDGDGLQVFRDRATEQGYALPSEFACLPLLLLLLLLNGEVAYGTQSVLLGAAPRAPLVAVARRPTNSRGQEA